MNFISSPEIPCNQWAQSRSKKQKCWATVPDVGRSGSGVQPSATRPLIASLWLPSPHSFLRGSFWFHEKFHKPMPGFTFSEPGQITVSLAGKISSWGLLWGTNKINSCESVAWSLKPVQMGPTMVINREEENNGVLMPARTKSSEALGLGGLLKVQKQQNLIF